MSSRKRGELLPKVYDTPQMEVRKKPEKFGFATMIKSFLRTAPYKYILCGDRLRFTGSQTGRHTGIDQ